MLKFLPWVDADERDNVQTLASMIPGFEEMFSDYTIAIHGRVRDSDLMGDNKILAFYTSYDGTIPLVGVKYISNIRVERLCLDVKHPLSRDRNFQAFITKNCIFLPDYPHGFASYSSSHANETDIKHLTEFLKAIHKIHQQMRSSSININQFQAMIQSVNRLVEQQVKRTIENRQDPVLTMFSKITEKLGVIQQVYTGDPIRIRIKFHKPIIPDKVFYRNTIYKVPPQKDYEIRECVLYIRNTRIVEAYIPHETEHPHVSNSGDVCLGDLKGSTIDRFIDKFIDTMSIINLHSVYRHDGYLEDLIEGSPVIDTPWEA